MAHNQADLASGVHAARIRRPAGDHHRPGSSPHDDHLPHRQDPPARRRGDRPGHVRVPLRRHDTRTGRVRRRSGLRSEDQPHHRRTGRVAHPARGREVRSYTYYDTDAQALDAQGWSVRLRHKSGSSFEESYKKRFAVTDGDIDGALTTADAAGFDSSDTNYDAEVDWGYAKQTLSFSNEKSHSASGYSGTARPSSSTGLSWLVNEIPGKLQDWNTDNWGKTTLQTSRSHGPVTSQVREGAWEASDDAGIEVLPVAGVSGSGTEYVVELSFKADDYDDAATLHTDAIDVAESHGWLYHGDILKTGLILDRY
ncbi:hypothetical protein [Streptomyces sp. NPDC000133]|uniref:hypothetical protein n=1 Tax=Streptomyces sp. NPDC000133 TaxID=3364535 RepID=UPI0036A8863D